MAFNFNKYKANNPLLQEVDDQDDKRALDFDLNPQDGPNDPLGPDEVSGTPIADFVDAIVAARKYMTRGEMIRQINQNTDPED